MKKILAAFIAVVFALGLSTAALATDDDKKIAICHHTGSQTNPTVTITVSENAWDAHKEHGDTKGECPEKTAAPTTTPGPVPPTRPPYTVAPSATPKATETAKATATAKPTVTTPTATPAAPKATEAPKAPVKTVAPVKQLPSTSTD